MNQRLNPRVQRARSSPSAIREPLTRSPSGNASNVVAAVVLTLVSTSPFACASVQTSGRAVVTVTAVDPGGDVIPGITVVLRHTDSGQRLEATTSSSGEATFEVSEPGEWIAIGQPLGTIAPKPVQVLVPDGGRVKTKIVIDPTIIDSLEVK